MYCKPNNNIFVLSSDGTILSCQPFRRVGSKNNKAFRHCKRKQDKQLDYVRDNNQNIIISRYISYYDSYIVSTITTSAIYKSFFPGLTTIIIIVLALVLLFFSMIWIVRKNLLPLRKLADHMASAKDIPTPTTEVGGAAEIQMITSSYNKMTNTLLAIFLNWSCTCKTKKR